MDAPLCNVEIDGFYFIEVLTMEVSYIYSG